jgi:methyl-accepting chemotaxis protein
MMMSIRHRFFLAFSMLAALACSLAFCGFRQVAASGDLVVCLYDGPLMGINHARSADATLNEARFLLASNASADVSDETVTAFRAQLAEIAEDLKIVRERIENRTVLDALMRNLSFSGLRPTA